MQDFLNRKHAAPFSRTECESFLTAQGTTVLADQTDKRQDHVRRRAG